MRAFRNIAILIAAILSCYAATRSEATPLNVYGVPTVYGGASSSSLRSSPLSLYNYISVAGYFRSVDGGGGQMVQGSSSCSSNQSLSFNAGVSIISVGTLAGIAPGTEVNA